ncbi:MarR family transcriptional regulator [Lentzea sp. BCCO 10_0798]|uniref:MarR family transcriptional regulator n=1 Tax=Lentzea kristufekii TaxID=3095430 RepID=A0ABU4U3M8_9PSEU|nr:MarR family transcriptional regulator [Lentzea sp. BCCO 10_0798]MDX8055178.1 MarR family transcriptional regulator [Lentzea sp. BCCO 10_0798]
MSSAEPTPGHLVWRLAMKWRTAVDRALDPLGLTHAQYVVLSSLLALDRPSQRELADHTGLEALYVSKLARSLEASGFISRTRDAVDTRTVRLSLTPQGLETVEPAVALVRSLLDRLLAPLGDRTSAFSGELLALLAVPLD